MSNQLRIKPVEGRLLPLADDPKRHVDRERNVPDIAYYRRAIQRGDVVLAEASGGAPTRKTKRVAKTGNGEEKAQ